MIKATIQNSPYCTEIRLPCSETELSKKLGELGMNPEHLAPMAMIIEIEPAELSLLTDCDVSLDALNYLGKLMDGMSKGERNRVQLEKHHQSHLQLREVYAYRGYGRS